jgi:hypothetical protein
MKSFALSKADEEQDTGPESFRIIAGTRDAAGPRR